MTRRTRIKICGLTRIEDALHSASLGADSIGLVFHKKSPRFIELEDALEIRKAIPPFVTVTALFMDEDSAWLDRVIETVNPDCLQFHGTESPDNCKAWARPYIKAIPMASTGNVCEYAGNYDTAQGFLLDSNVAGRQGGSGDTFDWSKIPSNFDYPLVLAGGLNPENVAQAIACVKPWGVDVSSGVELSKGIKDNTLLEKFFQQVARADSNS